MQADFFRRTQNYSFNMYFNMYIYIDKLLILVVFFFFKESNCNQIRFECTIELLNILLLNLSQIPNIGGSLPTI